MLQFTRVNKPLFIIASGLLIMLSYGLYVQIKDLIDSYAWINHTNMVELKLEQLLSYAKDEETAQRGFLLTKDSAFLNPYLIARQKIQQTLTDVKELTQDNPEQQKNAAVLTSLADVRSKSLNNTMSHFFDPDANMQGRSYYLLSGKATMDKMRQQVADMQDVEKKLLHKREKTKDTHVALTPPLALLLVFVSLTLLSFSYITIRNELNISNNYAAQLKSLNTELEQKNGQLQSFNNELDSFNYIASHDLKEPLRKIQTYSGLVVDTESQRLTERGQQYLQKIQQSAVRMKNLLEDLLAYSRTNNADQESETVDLNKIINEVIYDFKDSIDDTQTTFELNPLPVLKGISFQLHQLFENLISNSIKYRRPGIAPHIQITCSLSERKNVAESEEETNSPSAYYQIIYADNGIGFEQQYADKVFELFQRLHINKGYSGTGIGLTICKRVVQNHNGFISAKSRENEGTAFEILLPA